MTGYIPSTDQEREMMLAESGFNSIEELFDGIPREVRLKSSLKLPQALAEMELARHMRELAAKNKGADKNACFLGAGAYDHFIPSVVDHITGRSEFYTAYTPYQPEISQGTLQAIFEYQTMICELTGLDVANASVYDGATAIAEAASMACKVVHKNEIIVSQTVNPEYRKVLNTYAKFKGYEVVEAGYEKGAIGLRNLESLINEETAAVIIQNPNFFGALEPVEEMAKLTAKSKALLVVSADPISLGILKSPGEQGADIVVGEGQALGNPLSFGGPYLGFFAVKEKYLRQMPGRIVGQTSDKRGRRGFVLTMQAREQHIRREKATSNICSNQALNALRATVYLSLLGKQGLREVALLCLQKAHYTYSRLLETKLFTPCFAQPFFKEFAVRAEKPLEELNRKLLDDGIIGGYKLENAYPELKNCWLVAVTEKRTKEEIDRLVKKVVEIL